LHDASGIVHFTGAEKNEAHSPRRKGEANLMRRRVSFSSRLAGVSILALLLSGCIGYDGDVQHGYQMDPRAASEIHTGELAQQVLLELGSPSTTSTVGGSAWYYFSQRTVRAVEFMKPRIVDQRIYAVYFDKDAKVERVANYGMKDGRVFDFISRTTPTGGTEESFLQNALSNLLRF
jgi:outer membrane protein assembly factor BamE (lipoprotein component of BamABCDE complex)